jgi:hypothetical protein
MNGTHTPGPFRHKADIHRSRLLGRSCARSSTDILIRGLRSRLTRGGLTSARVAKRVAIVGKYMFYVSAGIVRAEEPKPVSWLSLSEEQSTGLVDVDDFPSFDAVRPRDVHSEKPRPRCDRRQHRARPHAPGLSFLPGPSVLLVLAREAHW